MTILPPNATFDLYRDTQDDGYGDVEDDNSVPLYTGIQGVLSYQTRIVRDPITRTPQQITTSFGLLPQGTDVQNGDRLHETITGAWFNVEGANALPSYGFPNDVSVNLQQAAG